MKLKAVIVCLVLCGCNPVSEKEKDALGRLEKSAFDAGVQSAINAHLRYQSNELRAGRDAGNMPLREWEAAAKEVWASAATNHP